MGAGSSKPADASKHVFASDTPVQFSQELVDSLQASSETNSSRAKTLELHIAERVAAELEKIQKRETETFESVRATLSSSAEPEPSSSSSSQDSSESTTTTSKLKSALPDSLTPSSSQSSKSKKGSKEQQQQQSSQKVQAEISKLKQQLAERKVLKDLPPELDRARAAVVSCLRVNDRRPLDCWKEVEGFKREVRRMEEEFVARVL